MTFSPRFSSRSVVKSSDGQGRETAFDVFQYTFSRCPVHVVPVHRLDAPVRRDPTMKVAMTNGRRNIVYTSPISPLVLKIKRFAKYFNVLERSSTFGLRMRPVSPLSSTNTKTMPKKRSIKWMEGMSERQRRRRGASPTAFRSFGNGRVKVTWARPRTRNRSQRHDPNMRCYKCGQRGHFR